MITVLAISHRDNQYNKYSCKMMANFQLIMMACPTGHFFPLFLTSLMKVEQHVCIVKVLMEEFFVSQKVLSYLFYFRPDSSMDILRKIVFKKLKLRYYYLVELLPYFFIRWGTCLTTFDIMSTLDLLIRLINYRLCIHNNFHFQMLALLYYLILAPI